MRHQGGSLPRSLSGPGLKAKPVAAREAAALGLGPAGGYLDRLEYDNTTSCAPPCGPRNLPTAPGECAHDTDGRRFVLDVEHR